MIRYWIRRSRSKNLFLRILIWQETDTGNFIEEAGKFFGVYEYQGIAEVTDVFRDGEHAYMAIEYLPGKNLREYLNAEKKGQITIEEAWTLLFPVLDTVSWMHSNGMVHGGIRMSRLIFDENDRLCLTGIGDCFLRNRESEANGPWTDVRAVSKSCTNVLPASLHCRQDVSGTKRKSDQSVSGLPSAAG